MDATDSVSLPNREEINDRLRKAQTIDSPFPERQSILAEWDQDLMQRAESVYSRIQFLESEGRAARVEYDAIVAALNTIREAREVETPLEAPRH